MDTKSGPQIIEHISKSLTFTPSEVRWVPCSAKVMVAGINPRAKGTMQVMEMKEGKLNIVAEGEAKEGVKCGTFGAATYENRHFATGHFDGQLCIWDIEDMAAPIYSVKAHRTIINQMDGVGGLNVGYGAPELVTCSRDGCVRVWDPRQTGPVAAMEPAPNQEVRDCWSVAFGNSYNLAERSVVAGYDNGDLRLLDLRMNRISWQTNTRNGVVGLEFDRKDIKMNKLVVTTLESKFRVYDMRTRHPELGYSFLTEPAHKSTVWMGGHTPQNRDLFMTAGGDGSLNMYKYTYPTERLQRDSQGFAKGVMGNVNLLNSRRFSEQPIVSFDWSPDKLGLCAMTALDQTCRIVFVTKLNQV